MPVEMNFQELMTTNDGDGEKWNNYSEVADIHRKRLAKAKRHRSENVSERDKVLFLSLLSPRLEFIENRKVGGSSKVQIWKEIEAQFNCEAEVERTYDQLRELWKRLKIATKKELEHRQKEVSNLPSSIAQTFTMLRDMEFNDDISNNNSSSSNNNNNESMKSSSESTSEDLNGSGDQKITMFKTEPPEFNLLSAIHLTSILRQQEAKNLIDRFAIGDIGVLNSGLVNGPQELEECDQGLDLTLQHGSNGTNEHPGGEPGPQNHGEDTVYSQSDRQENSTPPIEEGDNSAVGPVEGSTPSTGAENMSVTDLLRQMDRVPNLLSYNHSQDRHPVEASKKRRIDDDSSSSVTNSSNDELYVQKLQNEQERNKLIKVQLENERLKKELFCILLRKLQNGDSNVPSELLKSAFL